MMPGKVRLMVMGVLSVSLVACGLASEPTRPSAPGLKVLATETFLADIAQNVAGTRLRVSSLLPTGVDPHSYEPVPADVVRVADSQVLIVNGAGFERFLDKLLRSAGGKSLVIEAAAGFANRPRKEGETVDQHGEGDPHFWLDPNNVIRYVANIRDGLSQADPEGAAAYATNAQEYIAKLRELDLWIAEQVKALPATRRLLVTNHESFGYYADRYGFRVVGSVIPSVSTEASPSARQLAQLVDTVKATGVPAVFLETGANPQLAQQLAEEAGIRVVTGLYTHSTSGADGPAPTYLDMMRYDTRAIVDALR